MRTRDYEARSSEIVSRSGGNMPPSARTSSARRSPSPISTCSTGPPSITETTQSAQPTLRTSHFSQSMIMMSPRVDVMTETLEGGTDKNLSGAAEPPQQKRRGGRSRVGAAGRVAHLLVGGDDHDRAPGRLRAHELADEVVGGLAGRAEQHAYAAGRLHGDRRVQLRAVEHNGHLGLGLGVQDADAGDETGPLVRQRELAVAGLGDVVAVDDEVYLRQHEELVEQRRVAVGQGTAGERTVPGSLRRDGADAVGRPGDAGGQRDLLTQALGGVGERVEQDAQARVVEVTSLTSGAAGALRDPPPPGPPRAPAPPLRPRRRGPPPPGG